MSKCMQRDRFIFWRKEFFGEKNRRHNVGEIDRWEYKVKNEETNKKVNKSKLKVRMETRSYTLHIDGVILLPLSAKEFW